MMHFLSMELRVQQLRAGTGQLLMIQRQTHPLTAMVQEA